MSKKNQKAKSLNHKTILLVISGSIAAYKIPELVQTLRDHGARVICILTESAKKFVTSTTLSAISGERVYDGMFEFDSERPVLHTALAEEADLVLVAPASADFIARSSAGFADDLATCVLLATPEERVMFVPAMNDIMYRHALTQRNIKTLTEIGYHFIQPVKGHLVCGKHAVGHIPEFESILNQVIEITQ